MISSREGHEYATIRGSVAEGHESVLPSEITSQEMHQQAQYLYQQQWTTLVSRLPTCYFKRHNNQQFVSPFSSFSTPSNQPLIMFSSRHHYHRRGDGCIDQARTNTDDRENGDCSVSSTTCYCQDGCFLCISSPPISPQVRRKRKHKSQQKNPIKALTVWGEKNKGGRGVTGYLHS